jgi:hypothetical protein
MAKTLTEENFREAARVLRCDVAAIKAVAEVESAGDGFLRDGRVRILFEGHQFFRYSKGAFARSHPTLCHPKWTRDNYVKGPPEVRGAGELARLEQAIKLDRIAGLMSASYGKFQIMGFNFALCGFRSVEEFYQAMQVDEGQHLQAFCGYVKAVRLDDELREHRWADFARRYNGPEYLKNRYDTKLAVAHAKYLTQRVRPVAAAAAAAGAGGPTGQA